MTFQYKLYPLDNDRRINLSETRKELDQLGSDGFELVGIVPPSNAIIPALLIFIRRIETFERAESLGKVISGVIDGDFDDSIARMMKGINNA